jgi:hypothetical protein
LSGRRVKAKPHDDINPGNTVHGQIAFDIPKAVTPAEIELHGSLPSRGVIVKLN